ncbi:MAG: hypothetical protein M0R73_12735 [Dehalococcoidia bacterium]|nr:hypothetical protein [Dehalococcoidia bacterium]
MNAARAAPVLRARTVIAVLVSLVSVVVALLLASGVQAQQREPEMAVSAAFSPPAATIGDRVALEVRVQHASDIVVTAERPAIPGAEVLGDAQPQSEAQADGSVVTTYTFRYQVFALGEVGAGQVHVRWLREDGATGASVAQGPVMTVISVRTPGDATLRPLKPQLTVAGAPPAWLTPVAVSAGVVLVAGALAVAALWWRRRPVTEEPEALPEGAEARARERLDTQRRGRLHTEEAFQEYYGAIALAVREYLGERFGFNAAALTTSELERRMTAHGVDRWQARLVAGLLDRCDRAVYARHYPDPASADHDLTVAYEIVELSRPSRVSLAEAETAVAL